MKKLALLLTLLLAAGAALAQEADPYKPQTEPQAQAPKPEPEKAPAATKQLTADIVSTDATAKTITFKSEGALAQEMTLPVEAKALASLKNVAAGDKVKLTVRTDAMGKETAVTAIDKGAEEKPKTNPPKSPDQP